MKNEEGGNTLTLTKARNWRREMRDDKMTIERLCKLVRSGPEVGEVMANENGGSGAGQEEACRAQRAARV